jgi:hypothetical protein
MTGTKMLESQLEAHLRNRVRNALGGKVIKMIPVRAGIPDRIVMLPLGRAYWVELKADNGKLSEIQKHWHAEAAKLGHTVTVLQGRDEIDEWVLRVATAMDPKARKRGRKSAAEKAADRQFAHLAAAEGQPA